MSPLGEQSNAPQGFSPWVYEGFGRPEWDDRSPDKPFARTSEVGEGIDSKKRRRVVAARKARGSRAPPTHRRLRCERGHAPLDDPPGQSFIHSRTRCDQYRGLARCRIYHGRRGAGAAAPGGASSSCAGHSRGQGASLRASLVRASAAPGAVAPGCSASSPWSNVPQ